jgi:hypothetical protein
MRYSLQSSKLQTNPTTFFWHPRGLQRFVPRLISPLFKLYEYPYRIPHASGQAPFLGGQSTIFLVIWEALSILRVIV